MYLLENNNAIEKFPYTIGKLRKENPNTSFPKRPTAAQLASWGVYYVASTPKPDVTVTQRVQEGTPIKVNGNYIRQWEVVDAFADYVNGGGVTITKAEQEAAAVALKLENDTNAYLKLAESTVDNYILTQVTLLGYDTTDSIAKYLRDASPFYAECMALGTWIDACWVKCHDLLNAGTQVTMEELIADLPVYE